jgi:hypothetical protein
MCDQPPRGSSDFKQSGKILSDFTTSNGPDGHVLLVRAGDKALEQGIVKGKLDHVDVGALIRNQGGQNYDLPATVDLNQYQAVVSYCERFHAIFGVVRLESFAGGGRKSDSRGGGSPLWAERSRPELKL